jgi:hypothetical protein
MLEGRGESCWRMQALASLLLTIALSLGMAHAQRFSRGSRITSLTPSFRTGGHVGDGHGDQLWSDSGNQHGNI